MASPTPHITPARQLLVKQLLSDADKKLPASTTASNDFSAALNKLGGDDRQRVQLVLDLADVSHDNPALVKALAADPKVKTLRDVALQYNINDLAALPLASSHEQKAQHVSTTSTASANAKPAPLQSAKPSTLTVSGPIAASASSNATDVARPALTKPGSSGQSAASAASAASAETSGSETAPLPKVSAQSSDKPKSDVPGKAAPAQSTLGAEAASEFRRRLFAIEPTAVLQKMTSDENLYSGDHELRNAILSFFTANPDFNIRAQSIVPFLSKPSGTPPPTTLSKSTVDALKTLQRVQALTSDPSAIPVLLSAGVKSASQVAAVPRSQFVSRVQLHGDTASDIHRHASDSVVRSNMALTTALQIVRGTGINAIDGGTTRKERIQAAKQLVVNTPNTTTTTNVTSSQRSVINLEQLFGSMDYCDCSDCTSVTSPASYFVELLQYLRNNNLGGDNGSPAVPQTSGWAGSALEKLFRRRPDLADLELTCANTNTVLPYIDLSNEIMESFVVHLSKYINDTNVPKQATIDVFNMGADDDSAQILAQPQNVNYQAYCILKDAVYPFTLPYNQPIDEIRILLGFLNTSRYELISTFRTAPQSGTPDSPDNEIAINRAITAEQLLLTQEDYIILTLQAFYSKHYFESVLGRPNMSDATYQRNIGVVQPYAYWGYTDAQASDITNADESLQVGLTFVKAQFLPRSGIAYTDLVALVQTQYVNPNWPKGWALAMLEKIRYSYAYLYSLIDRTKTTKDEQLAPVIAWLARWQPVAELFEKLRAQFLTRFSGPSITGNIGSANTYESSERPRSDSSCSCKCKCCCDCRCCSYCIWSYWVLHYFELFGKLVVLDSKDGPVFGAEGWLVLEKLPPPPISIQIKRPIATPAVKPTGSASATAATAVPATVPNPSSDLVPSAAVSSSSVFPAASQPDITASDGNEEVDTIIGYLNRDGTITTTADTGTVTQIGHVASDCTLIYDSNGETFVQQYALDNFTYEMVLKSIDQTTTIGSVNVSTDQLDLYALNADGTPNSDTETTAVQWGPIQDDCNLDKVRLIHLDGSQISAAQYGRFQRFIRLWLKLGWTMDQLDQALIGLASIPSPLETTPPSQVGTGNNGPGTLGGGGITGGGTSVPTIAAVTWGDLQDKCPADDGGDGDGDGGGGQHTKCNCSIHCDDLWRPPAPLKITPDFLDQLAAIQQLQTLTGFGISQLLVFWADIGSHSGASPSLYQQLFLTTAIIAIDPVFEADANGNYLTGTATLSSHAQAIMAALNVYKPADLATLVSVANITDGQLTLDNLSALFRYKLLSSVLSIQISQLPAFVSVFGDPFAGGAFGTLQIVTDWTNVSNSGFTLAQLTYICTGADSQANPLGPSQLSILKICKTLVDGLLNILTSYPDPSTTTPVTSDMVAANAGLIYSSATVTAIQGVLNGTTVWTTNAPTGLTLSIPDSLSKKLSYTDSPATTTNAASATVSSTGILTADEVATAKAIVTGSNVTAWGQAIDRLLNQPVTWFQTTISGIFPNSTDAISVLLAGDVLASTPVTSQPADPTTPPATPDPGTAPGKCLYFLTNFMPFLRATLEQQLVTDTMTGVSSLSSELTALLLNEILTAPSNTSSGSSTGNSTRVSAMSTLMSLLNEPTETPTSSWTGYLVAPSTDNYTFLATGDTQPASIILGGTAVSFPHQQADPNNIWSSDPVKLVAGALVPLTDPAGPATQLKWQTVRLPASSIPSSALLPGYATDNMAAVFVALVKAGLVISTFNLTLDEITYFQEHGADFDSLDFNAITLKSWKRLSAYVTLRQSLQGASATLVSLFEWATANASSASASVVVDEIVEATAWDPTAVAAAIDPTRFNLASPSAYRNEIALTKILQALNVFTKVGGGGGTTGAIDIPTLFSWARPLTKFDGCRAIASTIRHTIRSSYDVASWEQAVQPLNNKLREDQKNALIAYLLVQPILRSEGIIDADSLFEFFLIDVQMSSCLQTSRIKQAISTAQVFIQRCLLGLELDQNGNPVPVDATRWLWMNKYVLWQANREIFLYPENYLVPSLRDDKSPFYAQLESSLNQKTVDNTAVTTAFKNYFYDVDLAANLLVKGLFVESPTSQPSNLHIVSSTRHTPQAYYYRQLQVGSTSQIWTPWEIMNVDIPTYTVEATTGSSSSGTGVTSTGSYVTPVVWNGRIFVLYPTFAKKTLPAADYNDNTKSMQDQGSAKPASGSAAPSYWYITMNLSERRDGTWAPKQVSTEGVYEDIGSITDSTTMPPVNSYAFIPRVVGSGDESTFSIDVLRQSSGSLLPIGRFDFVNGRIVRSGTAAAGGISISDTLDFGTDITTNELHSWQASSLTEAPDSLSTEPYGYYPSGISSGEVQLAWKDGQSPDVDAALPMTNFYHPFVHQILARLSTSGKLEDVFAYYNGLTDDQLSDAYGGNQQTVYGEQAQPYALYNWEPGLYALWELATQLYAQSQFDQALTLCQFIFNPMANSNKSSDAWLFPPFKHIVAKDYLENFFNSLQPGQPNFSITEWRNNAFAPFVVARSRPVTFMKAVVMLYLNILIAYGDYYFRQNTLETVPYAIQMYIIASHIYGKPGEKIPNRGTTEAQTYRILLDRFDAFDDAVTDLELMFPFSNQIDSPYPIGFTGQLNTPVNLPNIFGSATTRYFCIPQNAQLLQIRATIDDRLYKLRHCQDINGVVQKLPLFEPPLDIAALVAATAEGLSISSFLNDLDSPMPNYRFYFLLQKAHEVVAELRSLLEGYLGAREKEDGEALGALRQTHEYNLNKLVLDVKNRTIDEANATQTQLGASADVQRQRLGYFLNLLGMDTSTIPQDSTETFSEVANLYDKPADDGGLMLTSSESDQMDKAGTARDLNIGAGVSEALSAIFMAIPSTNVDGKPLGVGVTVKWGFPSLGQAASATSRGIKTGADYLSAQSSLAGLRSSFLKQRQERVQEANGAGFELNNINQQINTQAVRIDVATKDAAAQQTAMDNSQDVLTFLQTKYTNQQLYTWLGQQTSILTYSAYTLAYDLAKRVEKAYHFERPLDTQTYVQYGYWDDSHNGLLAGERLSSALRQIEPAYQSTRGYDYEITKSVSLRLTQPLQLLTLRQTGSCQFLLPEVLFDMDFPGHYLRRIKSVSLTLPCVTGPYTSVSCTLRLQSHTYRISPIAQSASDYAQQSDTQDSRFATTNLPISAIATSNCQSDAGVFDIDFRSSERYLPFEGAGAISTWSLELPSSFRQFDYSTIADAIMTVRYTSVDGGDKLKGAAASFVASYVKTVDDLARTDGLFTLWDLKAEFATGFYRIANPPAAGSDLSQRLLALPNLQQSLPVFTVGAKKITAVDMYLVSTTPLPVNALSVAPVTTTATGTSVVGTSISFAQGDAIGSLAVYQSLEADLAVSTWQLTVADGTVTLDRVWLAIRYTLG